MTLWKCIVPARINGDGVFTNFKHVNIGKPLIHLNIIFSKFNFSTFYQIIYFVCLCSNDEKRVWRLNMHCVNLCLVTYNILQLYINNCDVIPLLKSYKYFQFQYEGVRRNYQYFEYKHWALLSSAVALTINSIQRMYSIYYVPRISEFLIKTISSLNFSVLVCHGLGKSEIYAAKTATLVENYVGKITET